jgi:hypothetical protein
MGYFKDLKFGRQKSIDPKDAEKMLDLAKNGIFRTDGVFAPKFKNEDLANYYGKGYNKANTNNNNYNDFYPIVSLKPLSVDSEFKDAKGNTQKITTRFKPGFLPPPLLSKSMVDIPFVPNWEVADINTVGGIYDKYSWNPSNKWIGHLLKSHIESPFYIEYKKINHATDTEDKINEATRRRTVSEKYSARDYHLIFNDSSTDYFRHGLHIEGLTQIKSINKDVRGSWDGTEKNPSRLANFIESQHENNDPVIFGFEIVFDTINSPLLNGAVEEFIRQFSYINEIASKAIVLDDFKRQFVKIFKTRGNIDALIIPEYSPEDVLINAQRNGQAMASNAKSNLNTYANSVTPGTIYRTGKRAYMSYYLQKVDGLANLVEKNLGDTYKYLPDYRKDMIKLTFLEDLSLTMGTLAHLYKLLYWSKPNGKNLIPENLLRFNCDIIVSECRNFNRVRKAVKTGNLEIIKDNVSRYIYNLRECQFWFDKMSHEDSIDMGNVKTTDTYEVSFDYKYSALKLEKWVPDVEKFGKYVGYHNGAIWKIGNKGNNRNDLRDVNGTTIEGKFVTRDNSIPRFYTVNTNSLRQNGVNNEIVFDEYEAIKQVAEEQELDPVPSSSTTPTTIAAAPASAGDSVGEDEEDKSKKKQQRKAKRKEKLDQFKENSKNAATKLAKGAAKYVFTEINNQINTRAQMLESTINKARNLLGMGGLKTEPKRVYPRPYAPHSFGLFFDVRNELFNFLGDEVAGIIAGGMNTLLPGTQLNFPFKMPQVGATLNKLTKKYSLYDAEATLIGKMKSKGPKMPFFDSTKHSKKWVGQSINKIYNVNTEFKFPITTENVKYGGGKGVMALDYMKPKGNIYGDVSFNTDGKQKQSASMLTKYSNPSQASWSPGGYNWVYAETKNFSRIQFPSYAQKYPGPVKSGGLTGIYGDVLGNTGMKSKMATMLWVYSWPSVATFGAGGVVYKRIETRDYSKIGFGMGMSDHQKYPGPIQNSTANMNIYGDIDGNTSNLSKSATLLNKYSSPSTISWGAGGVVFKPVGTKDYSKIGFGMGKNDPQKYPNASLGKEKIYGDVAGNSNGIQPKQSSMLNLYSNPSTVTWGSNGPVFKPVGTKDYSKIGFGMGKNDPQKYPNPSLGTEKIYGDVGGNSNGIQQKESSMLNLYSKPSIVTWGANGPVFKHIGTTDFSKIGLGMGKNDPQKYPAPIESSVKTLESIVKSGTIWSYPNNQEKFGK